MSIEDLSEALGWVSISCWVVVYTPQIIENYRRKSGEGLSVTFIVIWLIGDLFNLFGAILAGLLPTVIILAVYYSLCDMFLLFQIYYYRWIKLPIVADHVGEESALLQDNTQERGRQDKPISSAGDAFVRYTLAVCFVVGTGMIAWSLSKDANKPDTSQPREWRGQLMGWTCAVLYLGARIPQILKNFKTKCEGLSPALFLFAILGNMTFALSICTASIEMNYLITNASWLAGSIFTAFLDVAVLSQFVYYRSSMAAVPLTP